LALFDENAKFPYSNHMILLAGFVKVRDFSFPKPKSEAYSHAPIVKLK
jgi:hypothetical protein